MEETLAYFKQAEKILDANEFSTSKECELFIQNVFAEVDGKEVRLACSHDGSQILEKILMHATSFQLRVFIDRVAGAGYKMAIHRYASHVLEAMLKAAQALLHSPQEAKNADMIAQEAEGSLPTLCALICTFSQELCASPWIEIISTTYGSHVFRILFELLASTKDADTNQESAVGPVLLNEATEVIDRTVRSISMHEARKLCFNSCASPFMQTLVTKDPTKKLGLYLLGDPIVEAAPFVEKAISDRFASHCIEAVMKTVDSATFLQFYRAIIRPKFANLIANSPSHFVIQHAISSCHNSTQFELIVTEDVKGFAGVLITTNRASILTKVIQWSVEHKCSYLVALKILFEAFHVKTLDEKKDLVPLMLRLQVFENLDTNRPITPIGCNILTLLSNFPKDSIKHVIDSFLNLSSQDLLELAKHPSGSRVVESFLTGSCSSDAKERIIRKFLGQFGLVATDKFGSHVVDKCWMISPLKLKNVIMKELVLAKKRLEDTSHGRLVLRNCRVYEFERKQEDWAANEAAIERKRTLFADIVGPSGEKEPDVVGEAVKKKKAKHAKKKGRGDDEFVDSMLLDPSAKNKLSLF